MTPPTASDIRAFRKVHGLSQKGLAIALGCSKRGIENWEQGSREPPAYLRLALERIADNESRI